MQDSDTTTNVTTPVIPVDPETQARFENLAVVGNALNTTVGENTFSTDFYLAKEALNRFTEAVKKLNLNPSSKRGIENLIEFLEKRINQKLASED